MEILVREVKIKLVTRLLPSSYFYFSSSRGSPSIYSSTTTPSTSSSYAEDSPLWKHIKNVTDPKHSVVPVLDRWIGEGNTVQQDLLRSLISLLKQEKRYNHALEISNWMARSQCFTSSLHSDAVIRASLFKKTCGLEHVEAYFNSLSDDSRTYNDYVTLLCCYVEDNSVEKAKEIVQVMREKGMPMSPFPYNLLINLYSRNRDFNQIDILMQEMEIYGIHPDKYTMSNLMAASVAACDILRMEQILDQMNKDPQLVEGCRPYSMAATGYLKAELIKPALTMLKKMEEMLPLEKSNTSFASLLTLCGKTGRKDELYRVWDTYKQLVDLNDQTFCYMMSSVLKLNDIEGAERIAEEWDSHCTEYDFQVMDSHPFACSRLWNRIKIVKNPEVSVVPVLDQWICEGNTIKEPIAMSLIWLLRGYRRHNHAIEISNWMRDCQFATISPSSSIAAVRLGVICRTRGLEHAKKFFNKLINELRTCDVYNALLCCYERENHVQKAEAIMQEMREKGMTKSPYPYNLLIHLYTRNGDFDKINILMQEMERNEICPDKYTMSYLIEAYVASSNISGMERILNQIDKDPQLVDGWVAYSTAAYGYLKFGMIEPALTVLRKMEKMMLLGRSTKDFRCLLSLYAKTSRKDDLLRVWSTYKSLVELDVEAFCFMILSLSKLEDIEGAERIFEEWESQCTKYDIRVLNKLLIAYCNNGLLEKAELAVARTAEGRTIYPNTWNVLARGYVEHNQMSKAVETFKKAISVAQKSWKPDSTVMKACFDYLEAQGDGKGLEGIIKLFKSKQLSTRDIYRRNVKT